MKKSSDSKLKLVFVHFCQIEQGVKHFLLNIFSFFFIFKRPTSKSEDRMQRHEAAERAPTVSVIIVVDLLVRWEICHLPLGADAPAPAAETVAEAEAEAGSTM